MKNSQRKHTDAEARNYEAMLRMAEGFAAKDVDLILSAFAPHGVFEAAAGPEPCGQRLTGREAIRPALERMFKWMPDMRLVEATRDVHGDFGVAEWTCIATTAKGQAIRVRGCDLFRFENGLIVRKDTFSKIVTAPPAAK